MRRYAPAMTRQDFARVRPHGNYGAYLSYITRNRPGWDPTRPNVAQLVNKRAPNRGPGAGTAPRGPLPSYESMLRGLTFDTPAQMEARANRMAAQQVQLQRSMILDDYRR